MGCLGCASSATRSAEKRAAGSCNGAVAARWCRDNGGISYVGGVGSHTGDGEFGAGGGGVKVGGGCRGWEYNSRYRQNRLFS